MNIKAQECGTISSSELSKFTEASEVDYPRKQVATARVLFAIARDLVTNILRLIKRRILMRRGRDQSLVRKEYDSTSWKKQLDAKDWLAYNSPENYIAGNDSKIIECIVDGKICEINTKDYYRYRHKVLARILLTYAGKSVEIVELGAGCAGNLISLASTGEFKKLVGLELSKNGIQAGREAASHFGVDEIEMYSIDLTDINHAGFTKVANATCFTYYCLEQLERHMHQVLLNIIEAGPKRVVHIEPTREILSPTSLLDINEYVYSVAMDYPKSLIKELRQFEREGRIKIIAIERLNYAPTLRHFPVLVVWDTV